MRRNASCGTTDAAEVSFRANGRTVVVTEKATNTIDTFPVWHGRVGDAAPHASAGATDAAVSPDHRTLAVRLADGSVATWQIGQDGSLTGAGIAPGTAIGSAGLIAD